MNITSKSKYALRAVIHMARNANGSSVRREDLAAAQGGISTEYLEKILLRLRENKLVEAKSGPGGGYRLSRPASELTAWDVVIAVEDSPAPVSCLTDTEACGAECEAKPLWSRVWGAVMRELSGTTISSLAEKGGDQELLEDLPGNGSSTQCR